MPVHRLHRHCHRTRSGICQLLGRYVGMEKDLVVMDAGPVGREDFLDFFFHCVAHSSRLRFVNAGAACLKRIQPLPSAASF